MEKRIPHLHNSTSANPSETSDPEQAEAARTGEEPRIQLVSRTKDGEKETVASIERTGRDPDVWTLSPGDSGNWPERPANLLNRATDLVLPRYGERLAVNCPTDKGEMRAELEQRETGKWDSVRRDGDLFTIDLITADDEGNVHDDYDNRTPLEKITCTTCLSRIAEGREVERAEAFRKSPGPGVVAFYTRRLGEAYLQLAKAEKQLALKWGHDLQEITKEIDHQEKKLPQPLTPLGFRSMTRDQQSVALETNSAGTSPQSGETQTDDQ